MSHYSWELSEVNMKKYQLGWGSPWELVWKACIFEDSKLQQELVCCSKDHFSDLKPNHKAHINLNIQAPIMGVCY